MAIPPGVRLQASDNLLFISKKTTKQSIRQPFAAAQHNLQKKILNKRNYFPRKTLLPHSNVFHVDVGTLSEEILMNRLLGGRAWLRALSCAGATTILLASCGGGGGDNAVEDVYLKTTNVNASAKGQQAHASGPATSAGDVDADATTAPPPEPVAATDADDAQSTSTPPILVASAPEDTVLTPSGPEYVDPAAGATPSTVTAITNLKIQNTIATEQRSVPFTVGQVFAKGALMPADGLTGKMSNGSSITLQVDVKATHPDGSVRHALISGVVPVLAASEVRNIDLIKAVAGSKTGTAPATLTNAGFTAGVNINLGGVIYTASADALLKAGTYKTWIAGPVATEWLVTSPLKTAAGVAHPHLTARFAVRSYAGLNKARVDVTIENNWAFEPAPQNFTYDATVLVGGQAVFTQPALKHLHHARWRKVFWWGATPQTEVQHNSKYLVATSALPNYDTSLVISSTALNNLNTRWTNANTAPMGAGLIMAAMPTTGGRPDIGPMPEWSALYLLSMDNRAKKATLGTGDLAGSWPIHYRDKVTDLPVSIATYPYMTLLGGVSDAYNPVAKRSEAFPACGGDCTTTFKPDSSHQPSMAYLPYVVTGDYYYLEELQFWATYNLVMPNPYYRSHEKGLVKSDQVRGQAWSLRTLGQVAYITPDSHPMKKYFVDRVGYNIDWYNATYSVGKPNNLGVIDGTGQYAGGAVVYNTPSGTRTGVGPWQDDFFTWSVGHLVELGYTSARPLLDWKAKFPIERIIGTGYCWIDGATYALAIRPTATSPAYATIGEAYRATMRKADGTPLVNSTGQSYLDLPCASQAMADWRTQYDKDRSIARSAWKIGEMDGYATSAMGYPSNMQPAIAVAATSGVPNARTAWDMFIKRPVKPDYSVSPQFAIVPRF